MANEQSPGAALTNCMLANYACTTLGVMGGVVIGIRRKNLRPLVAGIGMGTVGDMYVGYSFTCRQQVIDYDASKQALNKPKS